jgi:signal transduction histidine kinase
MFRAARRIRNSIFTKLILIIAGAGLLINLIIGLHFRSTMERYRHENFMRHITSFATYLVGDIGVPPDLARAREAAASSALRIEITGPGTRWSSDGKFPGFSPHHRVKGPGGGGIGFHRGRFVFFTERGGYQYRFFTGEPAYRGFDDWRAYLPLVMLTLVLAGAYLLIRKLMRPVKLIGEGIIEAGRGNLEHRVPVTSPDELGQLARSFNEMNGKIAGMIESRERLLLDVSHELRSPLTRMRVALEFLPEGSARASIGGDIDALNDMITEILETERIRRGGGLKFEQVDLPALVDDVAANSGFHDGRVVARRMDGGPHDVRGDRERLRMVFRNLIENALKYSGERGAPVEIEMLGAGDFVTAVVRDRGAGIPREELARIFEPFYRTDSSRSRDTGGYGLGLHICGKILEAHGGTITVESEPDRGTSFTVTLPAWEKIIR